MKHFYFRNFPLFWAVLGVLAVEPPEPIPCHLEWIGNADIVPDTTVYVHDNANIIARATIDNNRFIIGTYSLITDKAFFCDDRVSVPLEMFDILTNPHGCKTSWTKQNDGNVGKYAVEIGKGSSEFIGRASIPDYANLWYSGVVSLDAQGLDAAVEENDIRHFTSYDSLTSSSPGLTLELTEFQFNTDPFSDKNDFLGIDEIYNDSPATLNQTVTHTKRITEIYSMTTSRTWKSVRTEKTKIKILFITINKETVKTWEQTETETITTTESREVSVSRLVSVPPFKSIQACSTISIKEDAEVDYVALGKYTAPGLSNEEILDILHAEGILEAQIIGDHVVLKGVTGSFTASIAMNTEFYVSLLGSGQGCGDQLKS